MTTKTKPDDREQIMLGSSMLLLRGFGAGTPIVCEGPIDTALARAAILSLKDSFQAEVQIVPSENPTTYCIIGTKDEGDNKHLRGVLTTMKSVLK